MILIICLVLFIWALDGLCADYDHEAERRHKEMMEVMKNRKKVTRTVARAWKIRGTGDYRLLR